MSDGIAQCFNRSGATLAVGLYISKAFDRVWHACFITKKKLYGISGQVLGLILSSLTMGGFKWF